MIKNFLILFILTLLSAGSVFAEDGLRTLFLNNNAVICAINIRNFNAKDTNKNGFIDEDEECGNFTNGIERLDELKSMGINTIHLLPITPTGKLKALGTAGSLYAISDFSSINPQLADKESELSPLEQAKNFIKECHKRNMYVVLDLPGCGSYDLFLKQPELFMTDKKNISVIPSDWTDVRLFKSGSNNRLNNYLLEEHKKFIDMAHEISADGIICNIAAIKPEKFWGNIISYARNNNPDFLFLADASDSTIEPPSGTNVFTPWNKLLAVGFDGYYGSFFNIKNWNNGSKLNEHIIFNKKQLSAFNESKSTILSFVTIDELSPLLTKGKDFYELICWLEAVLPYNPYIIDGFQTGDDYLYPLANKKASYTETDDDYYFVHRGKIDIFNFSRKPEGKYKEIKDEYTKAMEFRTNNSDIITKGRYVSLKVNNISAFAFANTNKRGTIITAGNLSDASEKLNIKVKVPGLRKKHNTKLIKGDVLIGRGKIEIELPPYGIVVLLIEDFSL